ncbi:MAG TPA: 2-oxoacid:acceptor oxidoreductase subunit alpha, partial [Anaerolineae bacterium]|nr:2-oxoacid:acceptor oxidoreductase subunit alpha [Anaerolineae bacterium]
MSTVLMQGDEACAEGAIAAGCRFFAGYPITPATEIAEVMSRRLPQVGGGFIQMEDEIASIAAVIGASVGGVKAMTATSGPGFSLMQENIGYAAMAEIPCVIVDVQRLGPSTGRPTSPSQGDVMQTRWGTHGDHPIIVLSPSSVQETFDLTISAFNFSERYRTPVILLLDEVIGHMREKVELPDYDAVERVERTKTLVPPEWYKPYENFPDDVPPLIPFGDGYRYHITGLHHDERGYPTQRLDEISP